MVPTASNALRIAGEASTGLKAVVPNPDLTTTTGKELLVNFKARYGVVAPWPWFQGSAYDGVYIAAECLRQTDDDQDAQGFRGRLSRRSRWGRAGNRWRGSVGNAGLVAKPPLLGLWWPGRRSDSEGRAVLTSLIRSGLPHRRPVGTAQTLARQEARRRCFTASRLLI